MLIQQIGPLYLEGLKLADGEQRKFYDVSCSTAREGRTRESGKRISLRGRLKKSMRKDGAGIMFLPDGTKYEGQFRNDKQHWYGRKIFANLRSP